MKKALLLFIFCGCAWGGNKAIIDKNVEEMDRLNKDAIGSSVPELPKDGVIFLKAHIGSEQNQTHEIKIMERNFTSTTQPKSYIEEKSNVFK